MRRPSRSTPQRRTPARHAPPTGQTAGASRIAVVGLVTRERVASLGAALTSYLENCRRYARTPEVIVMDDSKRAEVRAQARAALRSLKADFAARIRYAGWEEKARFAHALTEASGLPREIVQFALLGEEGCSLSTGANRNGLLLDTVGDLVFSADDDTVCRIAAAPDSRDSVAFFPGYDPTEFWFFPDRDRALQFLPAVETDLLAGHERLLGQPFATAGSPAAARGRVAITLNGLVGDSGMASPRYYFALTGPSRERLVASAVAYASAFHSREVLRTVRQATISAAPFCMTTFLGLDNRRLLPPFFPVQRNSDGIFGLTLRQCVEDGHVGFLPWVLLHAPPAPRTFAPGDAWREAAGVRTADVVIACLLSCEGREPGLSDVARFRRLGKHLQDLGSLELEEFEAFVRNQQRQRNHAYAALLERTLRECRESPPFWADDVKRIVELLRTATDRREAIVPRELRDVDDARRLSQRLVLKFGQLLAAWPEIVEAAKRLRAQEHRLTEPM